MDQTPGLPLTLRFEYDSPADLKATYAHGVFGGINSHGEIEMNFYAETDKLPAYSERQVRPDGSLGPEVPAREEGVKTIVRHFHTKVLLNYQTARALLGWLEEKVEVLARENERFRPASGETPSKPTQ